MGKNTDTYIHQKAEVIKFKEKQVDKTPRGTKEKPIFIKLGINGKAIGNGEDKIYIFTNKTYGRDYALP